jgi:NAD(P)-dependent dehydrogenase (short-subunit alcohol dehydrogenase family)
MVDQTVRIYGRLDCAHNNAGIATPGQTHEIALDAWDRVLAVNLTGVFLCLKHEIAQLPAQGGGGAIVNTASIAGLIGGVNSAYVASNHGVVGLTKNAALEYAQQGIRVNAVYPGVIPTPLVERAFAGTPGLEERWLASEPIGRFGRPDEVARASGVALLGCGVIYHRSGVAGGWQPARPISATRRVSGNDHRILLGRACLVFSQAAYFAGRGPANAFARQERGSCGCEWPTPAH